MLESVSAALSVVVIFSGNDDDNETIEQCVNASLIVDVFGRTFNGEYLLENLYEIGVEMDDYADVIEENLMALKLCSYI